MVQDMQSPISIVSPSQESLEDGNPSTTNETSPFLPQHKKLPDSIKSVPIALAPTILPLTYNPKKKHSRKSHILCQCRVIFALIMSFLLLAILIHYILWLCLKKDKDMSLIEFILK